MLNRVHNRSWMDKPLEQYEFILPRDEKKAIKYICELTSHHAFNVVCDGSKIARLSKSQVELAAKIACEDARDNTKDLQFTNDFDAFVELAKPIYTRAYDRTKNILLSKRATFLSMKTETDLYGFDKAYMYISNDVEHYW